MKLSTCVSDLHRSARTHDRRSVTLIPYSPPDLRISLHSLSPIHTSLHSSLPLLLLLTAPPPHLAPSLHSASSANTHPFQLHHGTKEVLKKQGYQENVPMSSLKRSKHWPAKAFPQSEPILFKPQSHSFHHSLGTSPFRTFHP